MFGSKFFSLALQFGFNPQIAFALYALIFFFGYIEVPHEPRYTLLHTRFLFFAFLFFAFALIFFDFAFVLFCSLSARWISRVYRVEPFLSKKKKKKKNIYRKRLKSKGKNRRKLKSKERIQKQTHKGYIA
jgi:hypothetical protein